jgi:GntR family transcriptional regulator, galactonate operon transcriptional repressor
MKRTTVGTYPGRGLHGQVVESIGARIIRGDFPPGVALVPEDLEREYDVSKTVIREALRVLAAKGLVDSRQKRGTYVRPRSAWSLLDADMLRWQGRENPDSAFLENLAEVRSIVEPAGARLAAQRRTDADLAALEDALAAMAGAGRDADAVIAADLRFHRALLDSAHNELLSRMEVVIETGLRVRDEIVHQGGHWADSVPAHRALLEAVRAADGDAAVAAMRDLLAQASTDLADRMGDA